MIGYGVNTSLGVKMKILEKLGNEVSEDSLILYRTVWDGLNKIYGKDPVPNNLTIKKIFNRIDGIQALLLMRNKNNK